MSELYHYGIKGMKWGVRRYQNEDGTLTSSGKKRYSSVRTTQKTESDFQYAKESSLKVKVNRDGSETFPKGFTFNRVGKSSIDVNRSGGLYVSYGKEDAARYVKALGPTTLGKLFGTASTTIQHISVKEPLHSPSSTQTAIETAKLLKANKKLLKSFNDSFYSLATTGDFNKEITVNDLDKALKNPSGKEGQKLAYGVSSFLGDENYISESKAIYAHFREKGYDAIPDLHDRLSGTSSSAMIVFNPNKVEVSSTTAITSDVMKAGKAYAKRIGKLKVSDLIK